MSKKTAAARGRTGGGKEIRRVPNLWLAVLAGLGLLLSAYLVVARASHAPLYCPLGSGCEVVQSSRFGAVFGIPVAVLGALYYGTLLVLAVRPMDPAGRWRFALPVTFAGAAASVVFTGVQQVTIRATCSLCLASAALTFVILILLLLRRPATRGLQPWAWSGVAAVVAAIFLLAGYAASAPKSAAETYTEGLARHLGATGAKFYGAYWCPHCADQKAMFGRAAELLAYIECDPRSPIGQTAVCEEHQIRAFPTWEIAGQRLEGVLSLQDLARLSGYSPPP